MAIFIVAIKQGLLTRQVDLVLAYLQAPIEYDMYTELPKEVESRFEKEKVLHLKKT